MHPFHARETSRFGVRATNGTYPSPKLGGKRPIDAPEGTWKGRTAGSSHVGARTRCLTFHSINRTVVLFWPRDSTVPQPAGSRSESEYPVVVVPLSQLSAFKAMKDGFAQRGLDLPGILAEAGLNPDPNETVDAEQLADIFSVAWRVAVEKTGDAA